MEMLVERTSDPEPALRITALETMVTEVRFIKTGSDFHRLARFLETRADAGKWAPGRRPEKG